MYCTLHADNKNVDIKLSACYVFLE